MFTGIVEARGIVSTKVRRGGDLSIDVDAGELGEGTVRVGDSIAISGVCLTVVRVERMCLGFDVSRETQNRTCLGALDVGAPVNIELAMSASGRFGGHLVSGHVDGIGELEEAQASGRSIEMIFRCDQLLATARCFSAQSIETDNFSYIIPYIINT